VKLELRVWRQAGPDEPGRFEVHQVDGVPGGMSFLELLDVINGDLVSREEPPIAFDSDCREGICGSCGMMINGTPHGPRRATATCQLFLREFRDGQTVVVEPWRAAGFAIVRDLVVDRSPFDRIVEAGGYISVPTGSAGDANLTLVPKDVADQSMDAAACIGCGACVAACPNAAAHLFTSASMMKLNVLPQGQPERDRRTVAMVEAMESYFGTCTFHAECQEACPKEISIVFISMMMADHRAAIRRLR
jgi:succinate dehydrogenase / fumarate reductase, iron-sulfur subunit